MTELPLNPNNPGPFTQPFLTLSWADGSRWHVDVGGNLDIYLNGYSTIHQMYDAFTDDEKLERNIFCVFGEGINWMKRATPLLAEMIKNLAEINPAHTVISVGVYYGSGGPGYILKQGAFFKRMDFTLATPPVEPERRYGNDINEYLIRLGFLCEHDK